MIRLLIGVLLLSISAAYAGEASVFASSRYFSWNEKRQGETFVEEKGVLHFLGGSYSGTFRLLSFKGLIELWGGSLDYDGVRISDDSPLHTTTVYFGTREELSLAMGLPFARMVISPFAGTGHRFWIRSRSDERWNMLYARGGAKIEGYAGKVRLFAGGGVLYPFSTWIRTDWTDSGFSEFVTRPKGKVSPFAEVGFHAGRFTISLDYEQMEFDASAPVFIGQNIGVPSGVARSGTMAFQPDSEALFLGIKASFSF